MKNTNTSRITLLAFALLSVFMFSCDNDDDKKPANTLKINGTSHTISGAFHQSWDASLAKTAVVAAQETTAHTLYIATEGLSLLENGSNFSGTGKLVYVYFQSEGNNSTIPGGAVSDASLYYYSVTDGDWDYIDGINEGVNISVSKSGNTYTITFSAEGDGSTYEVSFKGEIGTCNMAL